MKNLHNAPMQQVVKASITTYSQQGFCQNNFTNENQNGNCKRAGLLVFLFLLFLMIAGINTANAQLIKGGKVDLGAGPLGTITVQTVNLTGENLCDFWLKFTGGTKVKSITVNGKDIKPTSKVNDQEHVVFDPCVADKGAITIKVVFNANVTNLFLIPTDSMHSDLLNNEAVNPNAAVPNKMIEKTSMPGGTQSPTFPASSFPSLGYTNMTGTDICDLRIDCTALIDCVFVNNARVDSTYAKNKKVADGKSANANTVHVYFKCIKDGDSFKVTVKLKGEVTTYKITPTDSIHADIMSNNNVNPGGVPNGEKANKTNTSGGKQSPTYDPSNYPRLPYVNETGTDICDMNIYAPPGSTIDNVLVNDKPVDSILVGNTKKTPPVKAASVHVYFPCIAKDAAYTVTVKFSGTTATTTYTYLPTDSLHGELVTGIQNIHPGDKPSRTITFPGATPGTTTSSNRPSTVFKNDTKEDICDLEITAKENITKIKVNGVDWPTDPAGQVAKSVHVNAPEGGCIAPGGTLVVTVYLANGKKIDGYTITFTNLKHRQIFVCNFTGGASSFLMPNKNSAFGSSGRSGSLVAINESCSPISQLVFTSPDPGIIVDSVHSTWPSFFDYPNHTLFFNNPVAPGDTVNFDFDINTLLPYSPTDSFPYTTIDVNVPGISVPFDGYGTISPAGSPSSPDGSIDFHLTGGMITPSFLWSNGSTDEDLSNLFPGTYTVTVASPSGCMIKKFEVPFSEPVTPFIPSIELVKINVWCAGSNNGTAIVMDNEPMPSPLIYLWSNGATTAVNSNLAPGTYTVNAFTPSGFSWAGTVTLTQPTLVGVTGSVTNLNCNGDLSGAINITPGGGTPPYQYLWNGGKTVQNRTGLKAATYTVTVKDANGCTVTMTKKVKQPLQLIPTVTGTDAQCFGGTGTGTVTVAGGTLPYMFNWSNGMTTANATGLPAGTNNVMVIDAHGCNAAAAVMINQPPPMMINIFPVGTGSGQAMVQVNGGFPPYLYQWNTVPVQTGQVATGLLPNHIYAVMVMDAHGCVQTANFLMPPMRIAGSESSYNVTAVPNPTSGLLNVSISNVEDGKCEITLLDATGRNVFAKQVELINGSFALDLGSQTNGVYSLRISTGTESGLIKVVIQK